MSYDSVVLAQAPESYLLLEENPTPQPSGGAADDATANNRDGQYGGAFANAHQSVAGILLGVTSRAVQLGPGTGRIRWIHDVSWQNSSTFSFSVLWRWGASAPAGNAWIAGKDQAGGLSDLSWRIDTDSSKFRVIIIIGGVVKVANAPAVFAANTTYHLACTHDGTNLRLYVKALDGSTLATTTLVTTLAAVGTRVLSVQDINMGAAGSLAFPAAGTISRPAYWARVLSTAEIADQYNAANGTTPVPPGVPTSVAASGVTVTTADLDWAAPATGGTVTSYEIRLDGGSATDVGAVFTHAFTGLTGSTAYDLEVRAVGPAGASAWVVVPILTLDPPPPPPPGYYRVELTLGSHTWDVESTDPATMGPQLPLRQGWVIPDQVDYFPAMPDPTTLSFRVLVADASDLADVDEGSTVTFRMFVDTDPDAEPWQRFDGIVTQLDGVSVHVGEDALAFQVTVYAAEDNIRLARAWVGYTADWPEESQLDRLDRVCTEASLDLTLLINTGLQGTMSARPAGAPLTALQAIRDCLADAADLFTDTDGDWFGRYVFQYFPDFVPGGTAGELVVSVFQRRVFPGWTTTLDGCLVDATGSWAKLPVGSAGSWVLMGPSGTVFGTPDGSPPIVHTVSLVYPDAGTSGEIDRIGDSLLPDGSTQLTGWYARSLHYRAARDTGGVDSTARWASGNHSTVEDGTDLIRCQPVVITPLGPDYELQGVDYVAGTLTGCSLVIPSGGDYYLELRLRPELLPGTELPA